jgi:acetate kinase
MLVLVANLGSTSFKFKLLDMERNGDVVARGGYERIGQKDAPFATHADVIDVILKDSEREPDAIGFKAVHGGPISGAVRVTDEVIDDDGAVRRRRAGAQPALHRRDARLQRQAAEHAAGRGFETAFHQTIPHAAGVRDPARVDREARHPPLRLPRRSAPLHRHARAGAGRQETRASISCHLGGSCSICAIENGKSVANSFGMTAQSGVPHNNRVGDFDTFALMKLTKQGLA